MVAYGKDSNTRKVSLARFPDTFDLKHTATTLKWPSGDSGTIQVILNGTPKSSYDSDEIHVSPHLPAVLHRDQRSLALPQAIDRNELGGGDSTGTQLGHRRSINQTTLSSLCDVFRPNRES